MSDPESELAALLPRLVRDSRVHFLDNLRTALIVLVIFHHAALSFGGIGAWYYTSPWHPPESSAILVTFVAVNQSYFMGTLFFLAGHFSAISVDRKPWKTVVSDKFQRLGIPAVVYTLFLHEIAIALVLWSRNAPIASTLLHYWLGLRGVRGPVWFIATLLVFDLVYVMIRTCLPSFSFLTPNTIGRYRVTVALCLLSTIVASFLIRCSWPIGTTWAPLDLQLGYAPQYILAYLAGTSLSRIQLYLLVNQPAQRLALGYLGAVASLALIALPFGWDSSPVFNGGASLPALLYAIWNELSFYFIGTALFSFFHSSPYTTKRWGNASRYSYGAFLVHSIVVVALQILVDKTFKASLNGVVATAVVGTAGTFISWAVSWALIRIPGVGHII
ncbi:hypothetical protein FB45DRAFT_1052042 [Roridomyces roridus]|uniref:Acyltransferase 3 domain-containing protein n=1 Tax=Roridomyces roridus TaxID=1738132 RepID=A0AAD7FX20_9AGAR|nr:hypothetical protein FB45DRAFT_1052042 [Roridomyces roridus]